MRKQLLTLSVVVLLALALAACGAQATPTPIPPTATFTPVPPTATPTPVPPTATLTPVPEVTLYLCVDFNLQKSVLAEECKLGTLQAENHFSPSKDDKPRDYEYTLAGDIHGTSYSFNLLLASEGTTTFDVAIVLRQNGSETVLTSTSFTVTSQTFEPFSETITGIDPTTVNGDTLIFRISGASGDDGSIVFYSSDFDTSFIKIPFVE